MLQWVYDHLWEYSDPPHLAPSLKKEYSYTSTTLLCLHRILYGKFYLFTLRFHSQEKVICLYHELEESIQ